MRRDGADHQLFGRAEVLDRLRRSTAPGRPGVLVHGAPGIGKTALAEAIVAEVAELAEADGTAATPGDHGRPGPGPRRAAMVRASRSCLDIPLGAFVPLLPAPPSDPDPTGLLSWAGRCLIEWAGGTPPLLAVDDLHLLDPVSAALVVHLVRDGEVTVVATWRSGETMPDALGDLWRGGLLDTVEVGPLDREGFEAMAAELLGDGDGAGGTDRARLWELTAGNPLYLSALARSAGPAGTMDVDRAVRHSSSLAGLVESRLAGLGEPERDALRAVALLEPIGVDEVVGLVGQGPLVALERAGLVMIGRSERRAVVRVAHPLFGEVLRHHTSQIQARTTLRWAVEAISGRGMRRHDDAIRVAMWASEGGAEVPDQVATRAGEQALRAHDPVLAARVVESAWLRHRDPWAGTVLAMAGVLGALAPAETSELLGDLAAVAADDHATVGLLGSIGVVHHLWRHGNRAAAEAWLASLSARAEYGHDTRELGALAAMVAAQCGDLDAARERLTALGRSQDGDGRTALVRALAEATVWMLDGDGDRALQVLGAPEVEAARRGSELVPMWSLLADALEVRAHMTRLDYHAAVPLALAHHDRAQGDPLGLVLASAALGETLAASGRSAEAIGFGREAMRLGAALGFAPLQRWAAATTANAGALMGELGLMSEAVAVLDEVPVTDVHVVEAWRWLGLLAAAIHGSDPARLGSLALAALEDFAERPCAVAEAGVHLWAVRVGQDHRDRVRRLRDVGGVLEPMADFVLGWLDGDPDRFASCAARFEDGLVLPIGADAAAQAAEGFARRGDQAAARRWAAKAESLRVQCAEAELINRPLVLASPLSRREREIAELAAAGQTARAIGERLFLSTRTVENHLARVYDKVGVRTRAELAEVLHAGSSAGPEPAGSR